MQQQRKHFAACGRMASLAHTFTFHLRFLRQRAEKHTRQSLNAKSLCNYIMIYSIIYLLNHVRLAEEYKFLWLAQENIGPGVDFLLMMLPDILCFRLKYYCYYANQLRAYDFAKAIFFLPPF